MRRLVFASLVARKVKHPPKLRRSIGLAVRRCMALIWKHWLVCDSWICPSWQCVASIRSRHVAVFFVPVVVGPCMGRAVSTFLRYSIAESNTVR